MAVKLTGGMGIGRTPKEGSVPDPGDRVTFTLLRARPARRPRAARTPEDTPWTHGGPPGAGRGPATVPVAPDAPDPVTAEDFL